MELTLIEDILYGAIASIGFATISNPPVKSLKHCGLIAGLGHGARFLLMRNGELGIIAACFIAALLVGCLAVLCSGRVKCPAESLSFPALLPMIPGMYAYHMVQGLIGLMEADEQTAFEPCFFLFGYNLIITLSVILLMVVGISLPIFFLKKLSFEATK